MTSLGPWFAWSLICIDCLAAIGYGLDGDFRRMVYWFAAAVLTMSVTI